MRDWLAMLSDKNNPYILTDDAGEDGGPVLAPSGPKIEKNIVGTLPDPDKGGGL